MSYFSEKLKFLIGNSGITIYKLAKSANLDRTTIQRSISGERLPNTVFVEKLCDYLCVSPLERKEIMELYSISKIGEKIYFRRKYVKVLLEQIAALHVTKGRDTNFQKSININNNITQEIKVFSGQYNINKVILDVLEDEALNTDAPCISLTVPFENSFLYNCLYQLYWDSNGKILIEQIIKLKKNPQSQQNPNINLEMLSKVLPLAFCIGSRYQPYYFVADNSQDIEPVMPYYICTGKRLITISDDFETAVLYNNSDILCIYKNRFQKCLTQITPLIHQLSDCKDLISSFLNAYKNFGEITNVIKSQPCLYKYLTHKTIDRYLRPEIQYREEVKQALYNFCNPAASMNCFFSVDGLKYFVNSGRTADLPPQLMLPFSVAERKYLLSSLRNDIQNKKIVIHAADPSKLQISSFISLRTYKNNGIIFHTADNDSIVYCSINEQSICEAFNDFFNFLPDSDLVYNKEDTIKVLDSAIEQLENTECEKQYD